MRPEHLPAFRGDTYLHSTVGFLQIGIETADAAAASMKTSVGSFILSLKDGILSLEYSRKMATWD